MVKRALGEAKIRKLLIGTCNFLNMSLLSAPAFWNLVWSQFSQGNFDP